VRSKQRDRQRHRLLAATALRTVRFITNVSPEIELNSPTNESYGMFDSRIIELQLVSKYSLGK
jgi:hypothetical protein